MLDIAFDGFREEAPTYREAAQSLMLIDRTGKLRVRDSGKRAHQTVVAEDGSGAILVMKTADVVSLHDLADCLRQRMPSIQQAMAMDGGSSSDIIASPDLLHTVQEGSPPEGWRPWLDGHMGVHISLPAVIGVSPRIDLRQVPPASASKSSTSR